MATVPGKHLVIFGCGYVGTEVARQALAKGMRVTALTRNPEKAAALKAEGVQVVVADLGSDSWHGDIPVGPNYVLNAVSSGGGGVEGYRRSYVAGMQSILRWATAAAPIGTLVYTSSTSVYPQDNGARVTESSPTDGAGELPQVLLEAENLLWKATADRIDLNGSEGAGGRPFERFFILRLAGIYGPGRHYLLDQVRAGAVSGRGNYHLNLVHRDDIAAAIWAAFEAPKEVTSGVFNVADDGAATKEHIVKWLAEQLGLPMPTFTGIAMAGRRAITPDRIIDNATTKAVLGWQPRFPTFREGYKNRLAPRSE